MMMIEKDMWIKRDIAMFMVWVVERSCDIQRFLNDIIHTSRHQQRGSSGILNILHRYWKREHFSAIEQLKTLLQEHHPNENISVRIFFNTRMMMVICNDNHCHNLQDHHYQGA